MSYTVKELFLTAQGEGANIGRVAVFIRFAGCNLWSGREQDRDKAVCRFCDTDFVGGSRFGSAEALADAATAEWRATDAAGRMAVLTGGEPLLQVDAALIEALRQRGFYVAVETNGTQELPAPVNWLCVSPKAGAPLVLRDADELKLVYRRRAPIRQCLSVSLPATIGCHRWTVPSGGAIPRRPQPIVWRTLAGGSPSRPTRAGGCHDRTSGDICH